MLGRRLETTGGVLIEYVEDCFGPRTTQMASYRSSQANFEVCWNRHFGQI